MSGHIDEQDLIKMLKMLDQDAQLHDHAVKDHASLTSRSVDEDRVGTDGFIMIDHGKIIVRDALNDGNIPTIKANAPVKIFIDGQETSEETHVTSENEFEWKIEEKPLFEISVSEDKLEAFLTINKTQRNAWVLVDQQPTAHLILKAIEDTSIVLEAVNLQNILSAIEHMGIKMNLDVALIQNEILKPSHSAVKIASGKPIVQGQDAQLSLFFSTKTESIFSEIKGQVDFKNHLNIPSVKSGDVIAKKISPTEGETGYDVYGSILLPEPVQDIRIVGNKTVEITKDNIIIALKRGRPRVTGNNVKYIDINSSYIVPSNVDLETGNIVFTGDVIVYGDVMDNMIIECLGNIYVAGSVFNATLTATGSIDVQGNVIGSKLYSGYFGMLYNRLYNHSNQLIDMIELMIKSATLLLNETTKKNLKVRYGQALLLIIETKYSDLWNIVRELLGIIASIRIYNKKAMHQLKHYFELILQPTDIVEQMTAHKLKDFLHILRETARNIALSQESEVQISIMQCQNSTLKSNGDILIRKEGVIQSDLYSTGNIIFYLDNSVCRGSNLEAGDTISAMYVGGITGVGTSLKAKNKVIVKKMYEGRVCIDRYCMDIYESIEERTFDISSFM